MTIHPHIRPWHQTDTRDHSTVRLEESPALQPSPWAWTGLAVSYSMAAPVVLVASPFQPEPAAAASGPRGTDPLPMIDPPSLSRIGLSPVGDEIWLKPDVRDAINGPVDVQIYVAGCKGLAELHTILGGPVWKIGVTEAPSPEARLRDLGMREYGSLHRQGQQWVAGSGFGTWTTVKPQLDTFPVLASPVVILPTSIGVRLPESLSAKAFDEALTLRLREVAIDRWARLPGVSVQLKRNGAGADVAIRATAVRNGDTRVAREVAEFYFFRKKHEFACLVAAAEAIVLEAVLKRR